MPARGVGRVNRIAMAGLQGSALVAMWFLVVAAPPARPATTPAAAPADLLRGTWHGTSICVDPRRDSACKDEEVIYEFDFVFATADSVRWRADKIVQGTRLEMGTLPLAYEAKTRSWFVEFRTKRVHAEWRLWAKGDEMTGTLRDLPSRRLVRNVSLRRAPSK